VQQTDDLIIKGIESGNPMIYFTILYQDILYKARFPSQLTIYIAVTLAIFMFILGYFIYLKNEYAILKRI